MRIKEYLCQCVCVCHISGRRNKEIENFTTYISIKLNKFHIFVFLGYIDPVKKFGLWHSIVYTLWNQTHNAQPRLKEWNMYLQVSYLHAIP